MRAGEKTEQLQPQQEKALKLIPVQQRSLARSRLSNLSPGWIPVAFQFPNKNELHFKTPKNHVEFRSFKAAYSFDSVLKQYSDESDAMDIFIKEQGRDRIRSIIRSYGSYKANEPTNTAKQSQIAMDSSDRSDKVECEENISPTITNTPVVEDYWEVEQVLQVRFQRHEMQFLVRWKGFSTTDDTWEPVDNLCDTAREYAI